MRLAPTLGSRIALAATIGQLDGRYAGLGALDRVTDSGAQHFQPAWATRAHLLAEASRWTDAEVAYDTAISLTTDPIVRAYLNQRKRALATSALRTARRDR